MRKDLTQEIKYLDNYWFKQVCKLEFNYLFTKSKKKRKSASARIQQINQGIAEASRLLKEVETKEKVPLIKDYYLQRITQTKIFLLKAKANLDSSIDDTTRNLQIHDLLHQIFPTPSIEERITFISEFVAFLKYIAKSNEFKVNSLPFYTELLQDSFYNIKLEEKELDFSFIKSYKNHLENIESHFSKKLYTQSIYTVIECLLNRLNLTQSVKLKIMTSRIRFSVKQNLRIAIPASISLSVKRLYKVIVHEIFVHVLRGVYGRQNISKNKEKLHLLNFGTLQNLAIEEGIATYFEQSLFYDSNKYDVINLFELYLRIILIQLALFFEPDEVKEKLTKLVEVYALIRKDENISVAKKTNILLSRVYEGFKKPQKGYINAKIGQYLVGNRKIWEFIESDGNIANLFAGKIIPEQIPELQRYGFKVPETVLEEKGYPREKMMEIIRQSF